MNIQFSAYKFSSIEDCPFSVKGYSRMKFGSDEVAERFGEDLASKFFAAHSDIVLSNRSVVIPSPYNYVENAATIMTRHFVNKLNDLLVSAQGNSVETSIIGRKVSYISDYGFLSKEKRKGLIDNDSFYLNKDFLRDKFLICVDDVIISGAHEEKLREVLDEEGMENDCAFVYFGQYTGSSPEIEARLNFAAIRDLNDYEAVSSEEGHHTIVRPLKFLLTQKPDELKSYLKKQGKKKIKAIYNGCLGEGYYKIPSYQENFGLIRSMV